MGSLSKKYVRDVLTAIEGICASCGAVVRAETGSARGHAKLFISLNGKTRWTPLSSTPRNPADAVRYKVSDVRRLIREMET